MAAIDHWHPVLHSRRLRSRPVAASFCGTPVVLFRGADGKVGALADRCPHRGMKLSTGWVDDGRLVCPYHGWSFGTGGDGQSPGTPRVRCEAPRFEAAERDGAVWLRREGSETEFPEVDFSGLHLIQSYHQRVKVPLLILLDNFTEIEHSGTGHFTLGYEVGSMGDVDVRTEYTDRSVRVINDGPQKWVPWIGSILLGMWTGDRFVCDYTTYFSPVYTVYDVWWTPRGSDRRRPFRMKYAVYFMPVGEEETELFGFYYSSYSPWGGLGLNLLRRRILSAVIGYEIRLDRKLLEKLADTNTSLRHAVLGRFDRPLLEQRRLLERVYYGNGHVPSPQTVEEEVKVES